MLAFIQTIVILAFLLGILVGGKWIMAAITVLTGDKTSLYEFGDLCEKDEPRTAAEWRRRWMAEEDAWRSRGGGGDPR